MLSINGVRAAVPLDAASVAAVQVRSWQAGTGNGVPPDVAASMDSAAVEQGWAVAIAAAPSARHRVLVAVADGTVVGFAATAPAQDPDCDPEHEGELVALAVDPSHRVAGHGSRLLTACTDGLRDEGCDVAYHWIPAGDATGREFLRGAGWEPDGAHRQLDLHGDGVTRVDEVRLHTSLAPPA